MAKLLFKYGSMQSGKTMALLQIAYNYEEKKRHVYVVKPQIDTKGNDKLVSRIGFERRADLLLKNDDLISNHMSSLLKPKVACILVDEAQFMNESQVIDLYKITKKYDIPAICTGLKVSFQAKLFEGSKALIEWADELEELVTICKCSKKARFIGRKVNGKYTDQGETVVIDGTKNIEYIPLCGKCYLRLVKKEKL